jgi:peptidoglycan/LPS O-acetylase OafA/YrhL
MDVLELTWWTVIPLLIVVAAASTTISRLRAKYADRKVLYANRARYAPERFADLELTVEAGIEREWVRVAKHVVCIFAVALMFVAHMVPALAMFRNWLFVLISIGLMLNSIRDASFDRRAMERHRGAPHFEP